MDSNIYRKKSITKISSPEDLSRYIRVTNPPVWLALIVVVLLLAGGIVWSCMARLETRLPGVAVSDGSRTVCYVSESSIPDITRETPVRIGEETYSILEISGDAVPAETLLNDYAIQSGKLTAGEGVYPITLDRSLPKGTYACEFVIECISPMAYLLNST